MEKDAASGKIIETNLELTKVATGDVLINDEASMSTRSLVYLQQFKTTGEHGQWLGYHH